MPRRLPAPCASPERIPLARSSRAGSVGMYAHRILELANIYNELPSLTKHQMFALQLGKMLSDSGPRRTDQTARSLWLKTTLNRVPRESSIPKSEHNSSSVIPRRS